MNEQAPADGPLDAGWLAPGKTHWIAFSGGPDSLYLLARLAPHREAFRIEAVHVDHGLDPGSAERARQAVALAGRWGLDCRIERVTVQPHRNGPEAAARHARYAVFERLVADGDRLFVAHHADDQVETVLLRLLRAAGPRGLAGMPPMRRFGAGWLVRPLLDMRREQIEQSLARMGLTPLRDPGNDALDADRNYLRLRVLPVIDRRWPGARGAIVRAAAWQRLAADALDRDSRATLASLERAGPGGEIKLDAPGWAGLEPEAALAVLRAWCETTGIEPPPSTRAREFHRQCAAAAADRQPVLDWSDGRMHAWRGRLWLDPRQPESTAWHSRWAPEVEVPAGGRLVWHGPVPDAAGQWQYRALVEGSRLTCAGGRQSATELLRTLGVPPWRRALWPALYHDRTLLALGAERFDSELERWMRRYGARLEWQQRPATLLPSAHDED